MNILLAFKHFPVSSGRYIQRALTRIGHNVMTCGHEIGNKIWNIVVDDKYIHRANYTEPGNIWYDSPYDEQVVLAAFKRDANWTPDLIITADSTLYLSNPQDKIPHVVWGADNHVRFYNQRNYYKMFFAHSWGARMTEPNAVWLPAAYDPEVHVDMGWERDIDVGMMGVTYQNRVDVINAMDAEGIDIKGGMGLLWEQYNGFYNHCKIALVRSIDGDLTQRFFENMAQGCCVLADKPKDADKAGVCAGVDYWTYDGTPEGAVREAKFLLESECWRDIAANGKRKVIGYEWDARATQLLKEVFG